MLRTASFIPLRTRIGAPKIFQSCLFVATIEHLHFPADETSASSAIQVRD